MKLLPALRRHLSAARARAVAAVAGRHRRRLDRVRFIGITGSCGKTTAKDLLEAILRTRLRGTTNPGSNNTLYATAKHLLRVGPDDDYCLQELSASRPGGLVTPLALLRPDIALVTGVGTDHYSAFHGPDAIAEEKGRLVAAVPPHGFAALNADDPRVLSMAARCRGRVITFGTSEGAIFHASSAKADWPERLAFQLKRGDEIHRVQTRLLGRHWLPSVLGALAVGVELGVPLPAAIAAVGRVEPLQGRMNAVFLPDGVTIIRDDFKAPRGSLDAALAFMQDARAARKIMVFGTISDYGGKASKNYRWAAARALETCDLVLFVGKMAYCVAGARNLPHGAALHLFSTAKDAHSFLERTLRPGDLVLVKASLPDHLARLILVRTRTVRCWRADCSLRIFCDDCLLLKVPLRPAAGASPAIPSRS